MVPYPWNDNNNGILTLDLIREIHVPARDYRISRQQYEAGTQLPGSARAHRCYVIDGQCRFTIDDNSVQLDAPCFVDLPTGKYLLECDPLSGVDLIQVWHLPTLFESTETDGNVT